jgi:uncharacterized protein (TIGR03790 family)
MSKRWRYGALLFFALAMRLWAGGSGLNVVVVVNQNSTNSVQLGNYYREQRQIPPQNFLRMNWTGGNQTWTLSDFYTYLYNPLLTMLSSRQLTNQVDYVVLCMDIPFAVNDGISPTLESTTSSLFYGPKPDPNQPCSMAAGSTNLYAGSEGIFRFTPPLSASSNAFLVTMLTASNLPMAKLTVDMGVASDSTFPTQTVYLSKGNDVNRNVRYVTFDNAVFNTRLRGNYAMQRINANGLGGLGTLLGAETGNYSYGLAGTTFAPGALADNLTSYGGAILSDNAGMLSILSFLAAGASGTYGTVSEPCNYLGKFPSPQNYFYQARGFSLAECYYQSVTNPYQGLLLGEPLAAPFAQSASGSWLNLPANALLTGTTNLSFQFTASDTNHPVQQVDLFLDGVWLQTLTNIAPTPNNALYVKLNGYTTNYTVLAGANLLSIASNLTARLNAETSLTKVAASAHGDRIELQSTDSSKAGPQVSLSVSNANGAAVANTTFIRASGTGFLDTVASGLHNLVVNQGSFSPPTGSWLLLTITKTNGTVVKVGSTNSAALNTLALMVSDLVNQVNANAQLAAADGCIAEDFIDYSVYVSPNDHGAEFNLEARSPGWNAAQIQATLSGSSSLYFNISPAGAHPFQDNLGDLRPRAHLYLSAGTTNLPLSIALNTTLLANGYHELSAVAYEGSHVRTQKRITQTVLIQNGPLSATFTTPYASSNLAVEASLPFTVVANTNTVTKIELFSTGGALTNVTGQSSATFTVAGTNLNLGLHPFYALVTTSSGQQYRTATKYLRLVGPDTPFTVSITAPPPTLSWPGTAGRSYDILATTNVATPFQLRATVVPTNSPAYWSDTNGNRRFYRVRTSPL